MTDMLTPAESFAWHGRRRPVTAVKVADGCPVLIWARFTCRCGIEFTADPKTVPTFTLPGDGEWPFCLPCWDSRNVHRAALGLAPGGRPPAYPEDYPVEVSLWLSRPVSVTRGP